MTLIEILTMAVLPLMFGLATGLITRHRAARAINRILNRHESKALDYVDHVIAPNESEQAAPKKIPVTVEQYFSESRDPVISKGWDITDTVVALGAPELPEGAQYAFFPLLITKNDRYGNMRNQHTNAVAVVWSGQRQVFSRPTPLEGDLEENLLDNAKMVAVMFDRKWSVWKAERDEAEDKRRRQEALEQLTLTGTTGMSRIGGKQEWVEDEKVVVTDGTL